MTKYVYALTVRNQREEKRKIRAVPSDHTTNICTAPVVNQRITRL